MLSNEFTDCATALRLANAWWGTKGRFIDVQTLSWGSAGKLRQTSRTYCNWSVRIEEALRQPWSTRWRRATKEVNSTIQLLDLTPDLTSFSLLSISQSYLIIAFDQFSKAVLVSVIVHHGGTRRGPNPSRHLFRRRRTRSSLPSRILHSRRTSYAKC
jgi:hypothetical protein